MTTAAGRKVDNKGEVWQDVEASMHQGVEVSAHLVTADTDRPEGEVSVHQVAEASDHREAEVSVHQAAEAFHQTIQTLMTTKILNNRLNDCWYRCPEAEVHQEVHRDHQEDRQDHQGDHQGHQTDRDYPKGYHGGYNHQHGGRKGHNAKPRHRRTQGT